MIICSRMDEIHMTDERALYSVHYFEVIITLKAIVRWQYSTVMFLNSAKSLEHMSSQFCVLSNLFCYSQEL